MNAAQDSALQMIVDVGSEYGACSVKPEVVLLKKLGLYIRVRTVQTRMVGTNAMYVAEFSASLQQARPEITVTHVGMATEPTQAVEDAVAQWFLGVLPVLACWRGDHNCFAGTATFGASGHVFDAITGPVVERGQHDGGDDAIPSMDHYLLLLAEPLRAAGLKGRRHWLECFAIRQRDGQVHATCRLDNLDWLPGKRALSADAGTWPGSTPSFHSRRQFLLLVPQAGEEGAGRFLLARLFGRS